MASSTPQSGPVSELQWVREWLDRGPELIQSMALRVCITWEVSTTSPYSLEPLGRGVFGNDEGTLLPHRDTLRTQAHVEDTVKQSTQLGSTGFERPGTNIIRA